MIRASTHDAPHYRAQVGNRSKPTQHPCPPGGIVPAARHEARHPRAGLPQCPIPARTTHDARRTMQCAKPEHLSSRPRPSCRPAASSSTNGTLAFVHATTFFFFPPQPLRGCCMFTYRSNLLFSCCIFVSLYPICARISFHCRATPSISSSIDFIFDQSNICCVYTLSSFPFCIQGVYVTKFHPVPFLVHLFIIFVPSTHLCNHVHQRSLQRIHLYIFIVFQLQSNRRALKHALISLSFLAINLIAPCVTTLPQSFLPLSVINYLHGHRYIVFSSIMSYFMQCNAFSSSSVHALPAFGQLTNDQPITARPLATSSVCAHFHTRAYTRPHLFVLSSVLEILRSHFPLKCACTCTLL